MVEAVVSGGSQLVPLGILVIDFERPGKTSGVHAAHSKQ